MVAHLLQLAGDPSAIGTSAPAATGAKTQGDEV
jgi:hypothetical protein